MAAASSPTFTPTPNLAAPGAFAAPSKCRCYAAMTTGAPLQPFEITRRAVGPTDVAIQIKFAGANAARGCKLNLGLYPP